MNGMADLPSPDPAASPLPWTQRVRSWWLRLRESPPEDAEAAARTAEEVDALIEQVARWVDRRRLETPAILFLEAHKPFAFMGSQFLLVGTPLAAPLFGLQRMEQLYALLEKSENVDRLIRRIEELIEAR